MLKDFIPFLQKYGILGLAIAVVIGGKVNSFVSATVADIIMPIVGIFLPSGEWQTWVLEWGPLKLAIGHWLGATIDFVIVAYIVFLLTKLILREQPETK